VEERKKFLDKMQEQNLTIALRGRYDLRMNPRKAIVEASEVLDENVIKNLLNNVPNSNKLQELETYTKEDFSKFTETELFVWRLSQVDHFELRLNHLLYMRTFHGVIGPLNYEIHNIVEACMDLYGNTALRNFMYLVLVIGNTLSEGKRKEINGFDTSFLTKLSTIQSNTKGKTMLHFLVDYVAKERDGLCQNMDGFTDMLGSMHDASKATESKVAHTIQKLLEGFENFEMDLDLLEENEGHRQPYTEFYKAAGRETKELEKSFLLMNHGIKLVRLAYCVDEKKPIEEVFAEMNKFYEDYLEVEYENVDKSQKKLKKEINNFTNIKKGISAVKSKPDRKINLLNSKSGGLNDFNNIFKEIKMKAERSKKAWFNKSASEISTDSESMYSSSQSLSSESGWIANEKYTKNFSSQVSFDSRNNDVQRALLKVQQSYQLRENLRKSKGSSNSSGSTVT